MTAPVPESRLTPEYQGLYRELQRRMGPGGDLSPGDHDTMGQYRRGVLWAADREHLHSAVLEDFRHRVAGLPRDGHAALLTAGAPGAGKGGALRGLAEWQARDDGLGRALTGVHGVDVRNYVVLDPDEFKVALFEHGGAPHLPAHARELPNGRRLAPSETASLTHRESAYLQGIFERWARTEGYNLLYDATLRDQRWNEKLLGDLQRDGYGKRVLLSVEVPLEQCLAQNAGRWQHGRAEFDAGRDWYGGRMAPEGMIRDLYARSTSGRGHSVGRENAEKLVAGGLATGLITSDRGDFAGRTVTPRTTSAFRQGDALVRIAAAGRLRSGAGSGSGTPTPTTPPAATRVPAVRPPSPPTPRTP
ncbi:zeta toxin family protein [Streptomyces sp. AC602_WCS936]|uniref:zeta toxin family protein n=1 Tax=Streptomyces sp. AC602_WCS936 TaxID=2823685 RepID=UPI001C25CF33|nr:zeta toxin family protein [Streptomyces sp. AC602_WCS936]